MSTPATLTSSDPSPQAPPHSPPEEGWERTPPPREFLDRSVPQIATDPVPACPVCVSTTFDTHAVGFDYELLTCSNPWRFVRCAACGHVWLNPRPALSTLATVYPPTYYAYNYAQQINPIAVRAKRALDRLKFRAILGTLAKGSGGRTPRSYIDIGCGDGRFLKLMDSLGVPRDRNYGLELDDRVVRPLAALGYQAFCERVEDCRRIPDGTIDLATIFHVIEHVDDPGAVVGAVARWLAPGALFAVETPNLQSLDHRLFRRTFWGGYHIPRHWNLFTPATLARLLTERGLRVVATRYQTGHSFWMYSVHHWLRYQGVGGRPMPRLARLFDPLKGLPMLAAFTAFDKARALLGAHTSAMLMLALKSE